MPQWVKLGLAVVAGWLIGTHQMVPLLHQFGSFLTRI
jgi:hypothetical protein